MAIERIREKERLLGYLARDRVRACYMIGGLDESYDDYTEWWALTEEPDLRALMLVYRGLSRPTVFTLGGAPEVRELVAGCRGRLPRQFYAHLLEEHMPAFAETYALGDQVRMRRMALRREDFVPPADTTGARRLSHSDTAALMELYRFYPDHLFEPYQLETGYYWGVEDGGALVAVSGIHVVSARYDVATIGNVVTHPDYRGRGFATRATGRLLQELLQRTSLAALNVHEANGPARAAFRKLGFADAHLYVELTCEL